MALGGIYSPGVEYTEESRRMIDTFTETESGPARDNMSERRIGRRAG